MLLSEDLLWKRAVAADQALVTSQTRKHTRLDSIITSVSCYNS